MDVVARILEARTAGVIRCAVLDDPPKGLLELAAAARLRLELDRLREVDSARARALATRILYRDLAYRVEIMPERLAYELADQFLELFVDRSPQYFTNGDFDREPLAKTKDVTVGPSWNPMTDAMFDTGLLVTALTRSGYLWVEDED